MQTFGELFVDDDDDGKLTGWIWGQFGDAEVPMIHGELIQKAVQRMKP